MKSTATQSIDVKAFVNKDNSKAIPKILASPDLLNGLSSSDINKLVERFESYKPKSQKAEQDKKKVVAKLKAKLDPSAPISTLSLKDKLDIAKNIAENSAVLEIHISQPWFQRKIKSDTFLDASGNEANIDPSVLHVVQDVINKKHTKEIMTHRIRFTNLLKSLSVPGGILSLGNGQYLIPLQSIDRVLDEISNFVASREVLIDKLEANYDEIVKEAREQRGLFFNETDYPSFDKIRKQFKLTYRFLSNSVPSELERVNKDLYESEKARIESEITESISSIRAALRESFKGLVEHLLERLQPDEDGKRKVFHETRVSKLVEFVDEFNAKNLTRDEDLQALVTKANNIIKNVPTEDIRNDEAVRDQVQASFSELQAELDSLMLNDPLRFVEVD